MNAAAFLAADHRADTLERLRLIVQSRYQQAFIAWGEALDEPITAPDTRKREWTAKGAVDAYRAVLRDIEIMSKG